jgi:drug/metabolite transporter (DMT)-like permease
MTHPDGAGNQAQGGTRRRTRRPLRPVFLITLFSAIAFAALMYAVIRTELSTTAAELAAAAALLTFGVMIYGLLRTILVLIESATERRRQAREATERRHGDRAREPD